MALKREWCIHYNGVSGPISEGPMEQRRCKAGVLYRSVKVHREDNPTFDRNKWPCIDEDVDTCPQRVYPTPEQIAEREQRLANHVKRWMEDLKHDRCPHCHQPMTKRQVGPCVYAEPCGHRLYQGRLEKTKVSAPSRPNTNGAIDG